MAAWVADASSVRGLNRAANCGNLQISSAQTMDPTDEFQTSGLVCSFEMVSTSLFPQNLQKRPNAAHN
jgi:hypothetical protein